MCKGCDDGISTHELLGTVDQVWKSCGESVGDSHRRLISSVSNNLKGDAQFPWHWFPTFIVSMPSLACFPSVSKVHMGFHIVGVGGSPTTGNLPFPWSATNTPTAWLPTVGGSGCQNGFVGSSLQNWQRYRISPAHLLFLVTMPLVAIGRSKTASRRCAIHHDSLVKEHRTPIVPLW